MPAQESIPVAATVLGTIGTVCWCIQLVPQVWYNWKRKDTEGLPAMMMFLWAACVVPFGVYAVVQNFNIPIQVQPHALCALSLINWAQILIYSHKWKPRNAIIAAVALGVFCAGLEVILILTLRGPYNRGVTWPMILLGAMGAALMAGGLLPPYWELWKRNGRVIGINWFFLSIDSLGALFSLFALVAQNTFDIVGGVLYLLALVLELGIFASHLLWRHRTRTLRRRAKREGVKFDDMPEARKYQDRSRDEDSVEVGSEGPAEEEAHGESESDGRSDATLEVPWSPQRAEGLGEDKETQESGADAMELDVESGRTR